MTEDIFQPYREFLDRLDDLVSSIRFFYGSSIICTEGCSSCCMAGLSLFPVEAEFIRAFAGDVIRTIQPGSEHCPFLKNNRCIIYSLRPVVCRTQGMPLVYRIDDGRGSEHTELSLCELNFHEQNIDKIISPDHVIDMDRINTVLAAQNIHYLKNTGRLEQLQDRRILIDEIITRVD